MTAHPAFLAFTVLCLALTASTRRAAAQNPPDTAQTPDAAAKVDPQLPGVTTGELSPAPSAPTPNPAGAAAPPPPSKPGPLPTSPTSPLLLKESERRSNALPPASRDLGAPRWRDAHHDRLLIAPTAETNPSGSFYAISYEIVLLQVGYAVTDHTQISLTATPPLGEEAVIPGDISIKTVVLREPHVSVAAIASASGIVGFEEFSGFLGRAGGAVTLCAEARECRLGISIGTSLALAGPASVWFNGVGVNWRVGRIVSLIAEIDTLLPLAEPVGEANGVLGGAGVRLSGRAWGVDLALMKAGKARAEASDLIPFVAATYRYVP
jgi:hypothetical protein